MANDMPGRDAVDNYDAYHLWLGIPPDEQPPSHYRLLGVRLFEENPEVIRNAADRQRSHVKRLGVNQYEAVGQQLLNEIESAKICLLRPEKRLAYDAQLRSQLAQQSAVSPAAAAAVSSMTHEETLIVGSDPSCDMVIDRPTVSGLHCSVMRRDDTVILRDLKSTNGTFVNAVRIQQPTKISQVDLVVLGRETRLKLPAKFFPPSARDMRGCCVGRSPECEICLPNSTVSSYHARVLMGSHGCLLEDFGSTNGTTLFDAAGRQLKLTPHQPVALDDWQEVAFGKQRLSLAQLIQDASRAPTGNK